MAVSLTEGLERMAGRWTSRAKMPAPRRAIGRG